MPQAGAVGRECAGLVTGSADDVARCGLKIVHANGACQRSKPPVRRLHSRLARTVRAWEAEILAWHTTDGCSNGPTEAVNLLVKKVKHVGHGFRNFTNYRLRLLLHCGVTWQAHQTASLRGRSPRGWRRA